MRHGRILTARVETLEPVRMGRKTVVLETELLGFLGGYLRHPR